MSQADSAPVQSSAAQCNPAQPRQRNHARPIFSTLNKENMPYPETCALTYKFDMIVPKKM